jgi:hypothetical protein
VRIKKRKVQLYRIIVPMFGSTLKIIFVTAKQLAKLNLIGIGKEVFLSRRYCQIGGAFWVVRTTDGLQYIPNPPLPQTPI